ncbi:MAG: DUF2207 domain-containing protein, partial [Eubacterium sp.]|nr:DUF2207 domain-containing protein [Candidatus Colimonas fimequi]
MKHLRRVFLTLLIMATFIIGCSGQAFADDGGYTVKSYDVQSTLHENNVVSVTEKITVNFNHLRHGIYRTIPTAMYVTRDDGNGPKLYTYKCKVDNIEVSGDKWKTDNSSYTYMDIIIGDEDKRIKGKKTYTIKYDYHMPDDRVANGDILYFSVLGDMWNTKTNKFTFSMKFDKALKVDELNNLQIYSGPKGERSNALDVTYKATKNKVSGTVKDIPANNAITVYAPLREGYYSGEMRQTKAASIAFFILMLMLIAATIYIAIKNKRKRPAPELCALAPDKLCPAEIGTIIDETVDNEDVLSLIPWFAQQGYLTMEERTNSEAKLKRNQTYVVLHKVQSLPEDAPFYQKAFFSGLFSEGNTCDLSKLPSSFASDFDMAKGELEHIFKNNRKLSTGGALAMVMLILISLAEVGFITFSSYLGISDMWIGGLVAAAGFVLAGIFAHMQSRFGRYAKGKIIRILIIIGCLLGSLVVAWAFCDEASSMFSMTFMLVTVVVAYIGSILTAFIIRPTDYKLSMIGRVDGFKKFIRSAEIADLEEMQGSNPNYFYEVLPYAMAFGMAAGWAKRYRKLKVQPAQPSWYVQQSTAAAVTELAEAAVDTLFDITHLTKSIETNVTSQISHEVDAAKASSGSGSS